ncbi:MAG: non-homologous end-joining DNA ligase [Kineosporiaceae bacterium]
MAGTTTVVDVEGRRLPLRNLEKVLYPATGTTKAEVLSYVTAAAPVLLPHLAARAVTRKRWPDGVASQPFFEKNIPQGSPSWLRTVTVPTPGSTRGRETLTFPLVDGLPALVWAVNLAALELHVPQWSLPEDPPPPEQVRTLPDRLVVDLDPGPGAGLDECCEVALAVREELAADGLEAVPVTSGSKGMQLYAPVAGDQEAEVVEAYVKALAQRLSARMPALVVWRMAKSLRPGKVLLDWSQNHPAKTTVCPWSLRGRDLPTVACPRTWDEVEDGALEQVEWHEALDRAADGDPAAGMLEAGPAVPVVD